MGRTKEMMINNLQGNTSSEEFYRAMEYIPTIQNLVRYEFDSNNLLRFSKAALQENAQSILDMAIETGNDLELYVFAKKLEYYTKSLMEVLKPIIDGKHTEVTHLFGCEIKEKMQGVKYDFSNCNDSLWNDLKQKSDGIKRQLAEREKFLKAIEKITTVVNEETGEVEEMNPPIKSGKIGVEVTLK